MNRFLKIKTCIVLSGALLLQACDSYLEENPDNRVELNTTKKAAQLLTNAYAATSYSFTEWMTDNVSVSPGTQKLPNHTQAYRWEDFTGIDQDTPSAFWTASYEAIAHANEVLAALDNLEGDEAERNAVKGEALLTRAYAHFMLVNIFAKHYTEETAEEDPGIPYVEEPETSFIKNYTRLSVDEVYDKIEDDLMDGMDLVDASFYANSGKYHFTRNAALAFASRYYLFMGDYNNCVKYSTELLGANPDIYVKDIPLINRQKINTEDYIRLYHSPNDDSNLLLIRQVSNFHLPNLGYWMSNNLYNGIYRNNPFGRTDIRANPAWVAGQNNIALSKFEFLFERSSLTSNVGLNYTIFLGFRGEEVLMNRAECYIIQNRVTQALADLQRLANKRYEGTATLNIDALRTYYGQTNNQLAALYYLIDERQKEFMHEGLRWFDIKRLGITVQHQLENGTTVTLRPDDDRLVIQLPQAAIDVGGLEPNPR